MEVARRLSDEVKADVVSLGTWPIEVIPGPNRGCRFRVRGSRLTEEAPVGIPSLYIDAEPNLAALHISDPDTDALVRQLAEVQGVGLTEAVRIAVTSELARQGIAPVTGRGSRSDAAMGDQDGAADPEELERLLDEELRKATLAYTRLLAKQRGTKRAGSRVYQMLARHGPVGTLNRLVRRTTETLVFLRDMGRLDLAAETIALDPRFERIVGKDLRARASASLAQLESGSKGADAGR